MFILHIYKGYGGLTYPPKVWAIELSMIVLVFIIQIVRLYFGFYANREEHSGKTATFVFLTLLTLVILIQFGTLTMYVLLLEILFCCVTAALAVLEILLAAVAFCRFRIREKAMDT